LKISGYFSGGQTSTGGFATMSASVSDTLTISGGPANGTLVFSYLLTGSAFSTEGFGALARTKGDGIIVRLNGIDPIPLPNMALQTSMTISDASSFGVPYTNGSGSYTLALQGMASCSNTGFCNSNLDLGHTLNIVGLQILDGSGNAVSGATVTSQSGLNYLALPGTIDAQTAVPEPSAMPIALLAAVAGWWARRRRRAAHLQR
jgi:hypothetical protein